MTKKLYVIRDEKSGLFDPPVLFHNRGDAMRGFSTVFQNSNSMMSRFPNDYVIYEIGEFDDTTGKITSLDLPELVCRLEDLQPKGDS